LLLAPEAFVLDRVLVERPHEGIVKLEHTLLALLLAPLLAERRAAALGSALLDVRVVVARVRCAHMDYDTY
jgi:hypothetical protein